MKIVSKELTVADIEMKGSKVAFKIIYGGNKYQF